MITNDSGGIKVIFGIKKKGSEYKELINSVKHVQDDLKITIDQTKEEFDEHLLAINENTGELRQQETNLCEMDLRLSKIEEKMESLTMILKQVIGAGFSVVLSRDEQRIFLALYTHEKFQSCQELSDRSLLSLDIIDEAVKAMMDKGIPIEREILNGIVFFSLKNEFKLKQAKEQIIKIDEEVTRQFQNTLLNQFFSE